MIPKGPIERMVVKPRAARLQDLTQIAQHLGLNSIVHRGMVFDFINSPHT